MRPAVLAGLGVFSCACGGASGEASASDSALSGSGAAQASFETDASIPTDTGLLRQWLVEANYRDWHAWSEVGPTLGAGGARVYLNDALLQSLSLRVDVHPTGAAAVRELYAEDFATLTGYSVLLKVASGESFATWYCFETLSLDPDRPPAVADQGAAGCVGCHAKGRDFIQSSLPLP